ncbi:TPA: hypothetical protein JBA38_03430 [Legionella pneumophila]|uniref:hypothetical protein n=1 Tax=Legionella pneumophila TaxID=446 RepID=UPI0013751338|nr:hypothetical protein [Legionella pneumophila]HAT1658641.1 hypothetical protein [Legionella pneumophila]HAT8750733.1 hypothetical protein [Legionella pneumophila]
MSSKEVRIEDKQEDLILSLKKEFSSLKISLCLPNEIQNAIFSQLERISSLKDASCTSSLYSYQHQTRYVNTLSSVFSDPRALIIWNDLFEKSPESTIIFIELLFDIEQSYEFAIKLYKDTQQEIKDLKSQIRCSENLYRIMSQQKSRVNLNTSLMMELILYKYEAKLRLLKTTFSHKRYDYFKNGYCPLSRKKNDYNALPIFFVRKIYYSFRYYFGSPMYSHIGGFVEVLFGLPWDNNEIKKHCKRVNSFYRE